MFTGIIQEVGTLTGSVPQGMGRQLEFSCPGIVSELQHGDSVSCNGVCLTVAEVFSRGFRAFAVSETLNKSNLGKLSTHSKINLELALLPTTRLGGHFVSGHVDGQAVATVIKSFSDGSRELTFRIPEPLVNYCISKGSVALNGVSLTIASIEGSLLTVALIPVTLTGTNIGLVTQGQSLNLEVDMIGKYLHKLVGPYVPAEKGISEKLLTNLGFHA